MRSCILIGIRWAARILAGLLAALVLVLVLCHAFSEEGLPNPFEQPLQVQLEFAGMLAMWAGWIIGWKWERLGGLLAITGVMIFHIIEGKIWFGGVLGFFCDLVGILFLLCWWLKKMQKSADIAGKGV